MDHERRRMMLVADRTRQSPGCGRAGVWDAAYGRAAESAQADFATFQRRIHSLPRADCTLPDRNRNEHDPADEPRLRHGISGNPDEILFRPEDYVIVGLVQVRQPQRPLDEAEGVAAMVGKVAVADVLQDLSFRPRDAVEIRETADHADPVSGLEVDEAETHGVTASEGVRESPALAPSVISKEAPHRTIGSHVNLRAD
jgi:hypothetical protein